MSDTTQAAPPDEVTSGYKTSEAWTAFLTAGLSLAVAILQLFETDFDPTGLQALIPAAAMIAAATTSAIYSHSRSSVKVAASNARALATNAAGTAAAALAPGTPLVRQPAVLTNGYAPFRSQS